MHTSSRVNRAVRNGVVLGVAAAAAVGLTGCKAVPSFSLDAAASRVEVTAPSADGASGVVSRAGSDDGAAAGPAAGSGETESRPAATSAVEARPGTDSAPAAVGSSSSVTSPAASAAADPVASGGGSAVAGDVAAAPTTAAAVPAAPASASGRVLIGTVGGHHQENVAATGANLAEASYASFSSQPPRTDMITVNSGSMKWHDVAAVQPGSTLYNQIVQWAQTLKARGGSVLLAYDNEPETVERQGLGTAPEFIAAYRHIESIFDQQGATNVRWTLTMTPYAFVVDSGSSRYVGKWYPGDQWIDVLGVDAYNWISCSVWGHGKYFELSHMGDPAVAFARAHGKQVSFPEFASDANPQRAQWLHNAHTWFVQNQAMIAGAFYLNRPPLYAGNLNCKWPLASAAEYGELRQMAQDTAHFAV